jgi:hypothetical protein
MALMASAGPARHRRLVGARLNREAHEFAQVGSLTGVMGVT